MPDTRMIGNREYLLPNQDELRTFRQRMQPAKEEGEKFLAAFVLIDAAYVQGKSPRDAVLLAEALRLRTRRDLRADANDDSRDVVVVRDRLDQPPLLRAVVHDRA